MGKKEYCIRCIEFYRRSISKNWGTSNRVVEIPACASCVQRHDKEIYEMKADFEAQKQDFETRLLTSDEKFLEQKKIYEELVSVLRTNLNQLKADNKEQRSTVQFLQTVRDPSQGDVVLDVSGHRLIAHGGILAARSAIFKTMVYNAIAEKPPRVIHIEDISPPVLEAVVDFCYSGEFTFCERMPPHEVLTVAHTFELGRLKELCDVELCRGLTIENVPQMLKLARKFSVSKLAEEAGKVFKNHFDLLKDKVYGALEGPDTITDLNLECGLRRL